MPLDFPTNPVDGQVYDNYYYDSAMGTWRAYGTVNLAVPAGIINQYGGSVAPSGYLMCTGQSILTAEYPALFQAIGYAYGGSGANFIVPDLRSRVPVGKGVDVEFDTLGETGGAKTHTLTSAQIPAHSHPNTLGGTTSFASTAHTHGRGNYGAAIGATNSNIAAIGYVAEAVRGGGPTTSTYTVTGGVGGSQTFNHYTPVYGDSGTPSETGTVSITNANNTGGDGSHNNLQPYIVLNYIIKT
jgi:microcystin-dependent protein